jgi:hypothetical protein
VKTGFESKILIDRFTKVVNQVLSVSQKELQRRINDDNASRRKRKGKKSTG